VRQRLLEQEEEFVGGRTLADLDAQLQRYLELVIRDLTQEAAQSEAPRILTGHFSVQGALTGSERQVMVGRDVAIGLAELADPTWDYVALGHIHKHQNLTTHLQGAPPVVYSGSMERIDFGEEGDEKGFVYAEVERGGAHWQFVPLENARPFLTLRVDVRRAGNPTQVVLEEIARIDVTDAVVRVIAKTDPETDALLQAKAIEQALHERGVSVIASIQREVQHPARMRLGQTPEGLTPLELMERYFYSKEVPEDRLRMLLEAAQEFFEEEQP
jgi:exonuclease SbcD